MIKVYSKSNFDEAYRNKLITGYAISILHTDGQKNIFNTGRKVDIHYHNEENLKVLTLRFDDCHKSGRTDSYSYTAINDIQAEAIVKFILEYSQFSKVLNMHIHCNAGVSRSGAVGLFAADICGISYENFMLLNYMVRPNAFVSCMLNRIYRELKENIKENIT